jgi:hypothetical protein
MCLCSKLTKVRCYSPAGDMRLAPASIPGSALHPDGVLPGLKVVGAWVGDDAWCGEQARKAVLRRLRPLDMVDCLRDTATIPNAEQLARTLITRIAIAIPAYWLALMRPSVTADAAAAPTGTADGCVESRARGAPAHTRAAATRAAEQ